jgi:hypothetical protein
MNIIKDLDDVAKSQLNDFGFDEAMHRTLWWRDRCSVGGLLSYFSTDISWFAYVLKL